MDTTLNIMSRFYDGKEHFTIIGFEPSYDIVTCVKGKPDSMKDLKEKLQNIFGVKITLAEPKPPAIDRGTGE